MFWWDYFGFASKGVLYCLVLKQSYEKKILYENYFFANSYEYNGCFQEMGAWNCENQKTCMK